MPYLLPVGDAVVGKVVMGALVVVGGKVVVGALVVVGGKVVVGALVVVGDNVAVGALVVVGGRVVGGSEHFSNDMSSIAISPLKSPPRTPSKYT